MPIVPGSVTLRHPLAAWEKSVSIPLADWAQPWPNSREERMLWRFESGMQGLAMI